MVFGDLESACGDDPGLICEWIFDQTDSDFWAGAADWVLERPLRIFLIIVVAFIVSRLLRRAIETFTDKILAASRSGAAAELRTSDVAGFLINDSPSVRAAARAQTIGSVLSSLVTVVVWAIAALLILGELKINLAPLLAGAGIAGIAIGFGAQNVVKDFFSGFFMFIEDQFGVDDVVDVGEVTGTVERVSLRTTVLRDVQGTVWHVPNGEIMRVANKSQIWSRALLDISVGYDSDLRLAEGVIQKAANDMWEDERWGGDELLEPPECWGVQDLGADGVAIRVVAKTRPALQFEVERELRLRIKEGLDAAGIEIPFPQRTVWLRGQGDHPVAPKPDPSEIETAETPRHTAGIAHANRDDGDD